MTLKLRKLELLPNRILVSDGGLHYVDNTAQRRLGLKFFTAYRKYSGTDKRLRIVVAERDIMGDPSMGLFYHDGQKTLINFTKPTVIPIIQNYSHSASLAKRWIEEAVNGTHGLTEGMHDIMSRYSYEILPTAELDILEQCLFTEDRYKEAETFKY